MDVSSRQDMLVKIEGDIHAGEIHNARCINCRDNCARRVEWISKSGDFTKELDRAFRVAFHVGRCVYREERTNGEPWHEIPPVHLSKSDENSAMDTHVYNIREAREYLWSFAEDEWEIARESFVSLCALVSCAAIHRAHVKRFSRDVVSSCL